VDSAHDEITQLGSWGGLVSAEDLRCLSSSMSLDRLRDLRGVLEGGDAEFRCRLIAEVREASGFGDRAIMLALARIAHDADTRRAPS
jgi:hypothetical protein